MAFEGDVSASRDADRDSALIGAQALWVAPTDAPSLAPSYQRLYELVDSVTIGRGTDIAKTGTRFVVRTADAIDNDGARATSGPSGARQVVTVERAHVWGAPDRIGQIAIDCDPKRPIAFVDWRQDSSQDWRPLADAGLLHEVADFLASQSLFLVVDGKVVDRTPLINSQVATESTDADDTVARRTASLPAIAFRNMSDGSDVAFDRQLQLLEVEERDDPLFLVLPEHLDDHDHAANVTQRTLTVLCAVERRFRLPPIVAVTFCDIPTSGGSDRLFATVELAEVKGEPCWVLFIDEGFIRASTYDATNSAFSECVEAGQFSGVVAPLESAVCSALVDPMIEARTSRVTRNVSRSLVLGGSASIAALFTHFGPVGPLLQGFGLVSLLYGGVGLGINREDKYVSVDRKLGECATSLRPDALPLTELVSRSPEHAAEALEHFSIRAGDDPQTAVRKVFVAAFFDPDIARGFGSAFDSFRHKTWSLREIES
jgi:hypothetical protein